jgi:hypothetical protein
MCTGFSVIFLGTMFGPNTGIYLAIVGLVGVIAGLLAGITASLYGIKPPAAATAYWQEMRNPEGEAIYDRAKARAAASAANASTGGQ